MNNNNITKPGFIKLSTFQTPPDDDPIGVEYLTELNPSDEVIEDTDNLTLEELTHLMIDVVSSFEVTHKDYKAPSKDVFDRAGSVVGFFKEHFLVE